MPELKGDKMDFHAHIYYDNTHRDAAVDLHARLQAVCAPAGEAIEIYPLVDRLVGPHLWPMFEIAFAGEVYQPLVAFLAANRGELPVLIHPLTPDEIANHGALARWLGEALPLNWQRLMGAA